MREVLQWTFKNFREAWMSHVSGQDDVKRVFESPLQHFPLSFP